MDLASKGEPQTVIDGKVQWTRMSDMKTRETVHLPNNEICANLGLVAERCDMDPGPLAICEQ